MITFISFFQPETLVFDAKFGPFKAGRLYMISSGRTTWKGVPAYRFLLLASGGVPFYKIEDTITSITDTLLRPLLYHKIQHEGKYHAWMWISYDHNGGKANYSDGRVFNIPKGSLDPLTLVYFARTLDYSSNKVFKIPYHTDAVTETVKIKVVKEEKVRTPLGEFDCWVVTPSMKSGRNVFGGSGGLKVWIDKKSRVPVKVEAKMIFGSVIGYLIRRS